MAQVVFAALSGAEAYTGKGYFFGPNLYRRYDWSSDSLEDGGTLPAPTEPDYQAAAPSSDEPSLVAATSAEPESPTARTPERT